MRFSGKVVAINGGTSGIGAAAVKRFVEEGATVYFSGRNEEKAEQVASTEASYINGTDLVIDGGYSLK